LNSCLLSQVTVGKYPREGNDLNVMVSSGLATEGITVDRIRVVLADDHREVILKIRGILGDDEYDIVEAAVNGNQAVTAVLELDPDVFVTDISMPLLNGLQAARRIQKANSRVKIIFLTIHEDRDFIAAAFSAGATGYVTKRRLSIDLVFAIKEALKGHTFVSNSTRT
jgi:DNA-binding NarL/FixJ family response regulator